MTLPMEKAYYNARATSTPIIYGDSKDGAIQIAVEFCVEEHDQFTGEAITWVGHYTDKTAERTIESLIHAGWTGEELIELRGVPGSEALPEMVQIVVEGEQDLEGNWR